MPSNKPRIATYTSQESVDKFKVIASLNRMSMSEYLNYLVEKSISDYETEHGEIKFDV